MDSAHVLAEATVLVPKGIVCLISALQFHSLTLQMPSAVWIAIERTAWKPGISYPPIRFVRFSGWAMTKGVERYPIESRRVPITDPARTIVDCFRYRNKDRRRCCDGGAARRDSAAQMYAGPALGLREERPRVDDHALLC